MDSTPLGTRCDSGPTAVALHFMASWPFTKDINLGKEYVSLKHFSCQVEVTNFAHVLVGIYLTFKTFILVDHIRRAACAAR